MKTARFLRWGLVLLPLVAAAPAVALERPLRGGEDKEEGAGVVAQATGAALPAEYCFVSGSATAPDYLKFCVSPRGHLTRFEAPFGLVHITGREGYVLCADADRDRATGFDAGIVEEGWGPPVVSQPSGAGTLPLVVTRTSLDGRVELKQTFSRNLAERGIDIKMDVKNLSGSVLPGVELHRYFDADIDGTSKDSWERSRAESVWASDVPQGEMLALTTVSPQFGATFAMVEAYVDWLPSGGSYESARACVGYGSHITAGDGVGRLARDFGAINPGVTKSVTVRYRRF
jgi:hypothetical protein